MSPVKARSVTIGTDKFKVRQGPNNFIRNSASVMSPPTDIPGQPGAQNLIRHLYPWILTEFSGGEGRLVFDQSDPLGPPAYKQSSAIDTRTRGQISMQPLPELKVNTAAATTTRTEGNDLTNATGGEVDSGTNLRIDAANEGGYVSESPGAVARTVSARFLTGGGFAGSDTITARLRIRNQTDATDTTSTTYGFDNTFQEATLTVNFTGTAGKAYRYYAEISAYTDNTPTTSPYVEVDYVEFTTAGSLTDPRALFHGRADNIVMVNWDGTNSDIFVWDFTNSEWDSIHANARNSQIRAFCSTDTYDYFAYDDQTVWKSDGATHSQYLAAAPANTDTWGLAVANNRLYFLTLGSDRYLHECTLDGAPGAGGYTENTADYKRVMTAADFPNDSSLDLTYRQRITSVGNGVRFFINMRGGPTHIFEFSEGAGRPLPLSLPQGFKATAIHHYQGTTFVGGVWQNQAASPAQTRAGAFYIGADLIPRSLGIFRFHDPDDEPIRYITAWENDVYFLQGNNVWRYSGVTGGIVLDRNTGASDETAARGFAVMDRKQWVAYASQGVFVTQNSYPRDNTQYLQSPVWDWDIPDTNKTLLQIDVVTQPLPANTSITVDYQDNEDGTWTSITAPASASTTGSTTHIFAVWGTAATPLTVNFRNLQWRVGLRSSDGVSTPTVRSVTARAMVIDYQDMVKARLDLTNNTSSNHITGQQLSGRQAAERLRTYKDAKALVTYEDHHSSERPGDKDTYAAVLTDVEFDLDDKGEGTALVTLVLIS